MISKSAAKKLRDIYKGQMITIFLTNMNIVTVTEEQQEISVTAMRSGFCIDVDQDYFYLGLPTGETTSTVKHELAQMVEIEFNGSDMLDFDFPETEGDVH